MQLDGTDVRALDASWLRSQIGLVRQEPVLFAGTIRDNIAFGAGHATDAAVVDAARQANAHGFITSFSDGYDTVEGLMEDAIAFEFRDQIRAEAESAQTSLRNLRNNGVASKPNGAQPEAPEPSTEEVEDQILALLESDAPDRVQRARMLSGR